MKKILITSGGTIEPIDDVRVITNISTGSMGATIADAMVQAPTVEKIYYIHASNAKLPDAVYTEHISHKIELIEANRTMDVLARMEELVPKVDVVIHAMAISDFGFKNETATKLKSSDPQAFIDYMRDNIIINPKIVKQVKVMNPDVKLVSFKFEVNKTEEELLNIACASMEGSNSDYVVANDKKDMEGGRYIGYVIDGFTKGYDKVNSKQEVAEYLRGLLCRRGE